MSDEVIIIVADDNYESHAQSLMVNCRKEGRWEGDLCLITPEGSHMAGMRNRGFPIHEVPDEGFMSKFSIFDKYFYNWKWAFYTDCDVIVQGNLNRLFELLKHRPQGRWQRRPIYVNHEDNSSLTSWKKWDKEGGGEPHTQLLTSMEQEFPHVNDPMVCTAMLLFEPVSVQVRTPDKLRALQARFCEANRPGDGGMDQQIFNLPPELYNQMAEIPEKMFCYWGLDEPNSRVASDTRGYKGGELPVVLHYCRWYAPWVEKTPDADAYMARRLGVPCIEVYRRNLAMFDELFPVQAEAEEEATEDE